MSAPIDDETDLFVDDFYALLNISRDASTEEVNNAYRRFSKIYHPDKHSDPKKKKNAEAMFFKIKRAYEGFLSDHHTRVIYDLYGPKGLETDGLEVIARTKSPSEIVAEYERLQQEREERLLEKCTNPRGVLTMNIDATDVFESYSHYSDDHDDDSQLHIPHLEISKMSLQQSVEAPLTTQDTATIVAQLASQNGIGVGSLTMNWRRLASQRGWYETSVGNGLGLGVHLFRQMQKSCYCTLTAGVTAKSGGYKPVLNAAVAWQLSKSVKGQMAWSISAPSSMTTSVIYDSEKHHAVFSIQFGIRDTFLLTSYTRKFLEGKLRIMGKLTFFGGYVKCGVEKKITKFSHLGVALMVGVPDGVTVHFKLMRGGQTFVCPVHLSDNIVPSAVFYGLVTPLITYQVIKHLFISPFLKQQRDANIERKKERFAQLLQQKMAEAAAAMELMKDTVARVVATEEARRGLVILKATYGKISASVDEVMVDTECIDVTIPLQSLVKDSKLILSDPTSKATLAGFYDPCYGEDKHLYIRYRFRNDLHQVTLADMDPVRLPQQKHRLTTNNASSAST